MAKKKKKNYCNYNLDLNICEYCGLWFSSEDITKILCYKKHIHNICKECYKEFNEDKLCTEEF